MGDIPKQPMFFIQDPLTEEVKGPLTAQQLRKWFAQGQVQDWGVSKLPDGPWTPAAEVKGLGASIPPPPPAPASGHRGESSGVVKTVRSQNSGSGRRTPEYEGDPDSWGGLVRDVFSAIATKWREEKPKERSVGLGRFVRGVAISILGLLCVVVFLGIGFLPGPGAGVGGSSELSQKPGEAKASNDSTAKRPSQQNRGGSDPVQLFKEQVLDRILANSQRVYLINEAPGKWWYEIHDCKVSYDIQKTDSLVSPLIAIVSLDPGETYPVYDNGNHWGSREALLKAPQQPRKSSPDKVNRGPFKFVLENGEWTYAPTEYQSKYYGDAGAPWPIRAEKYEDTKKGWKRIQSLDDI